MKTIGIICEYNPFHNGHVYHIKKIKEMYPLSRIILVMSGNFSERGDVSLINKWDKAKIALDYGVDLVLELPFVFATQSADVFAHGAISMLNCMQVDYLVFGSECNDVSFLTNLANIQINNNSYDLLVKKYMMDGNNYPTSMSLALKDLTGFTISEPNDILGLCYIKEILITKSSIKPISIKRTNDYHSNSLSTICSASAIRNAILNDCDIKSYVPCEDIINKKAFLNNYFSFLKYKIMTSDLSLYMTVDDGIITRIKKNIYNSSSLEQFIDKVKTKRYTYNKIKRMCIHILCGFTKEEALLCKDIHYIRVLGFNNIGKDYLNCVKHSSSVPIISNFSSLKDIGLDIEFRSTCIYSLIFSNSIGIIESEYKNKPIIK